MALNTDSSGIVRPDGTLAPVHCGVAGPITVNVLVEAPVQLAGPSVHILLDFNVQNSFVPDPPDANAFVLLPWIRAVTSGS